VPCSRAPLRFSQITNLVISKPTAFSLFQLGIFCSLGPGNPDVRMHRVIFYIRVF